MKDSVKLLSAVYAAEVLLGAAAVAAAWGHLVVGVVDVFAGGSADDCGTEVSGDVSRSKPIAAQVGAEDTLANSQSSALFASSHKPASGHAI